MSNTKAYMKPEQFTVAYIRDELRNNRFGGDLFDGLRFMLEQYDQVNTHLKRYTHPKEYVYVEKLDYVKPSASRIDVV